MDHVRFDRRSLLKKGAVAGVVAWTAPVVVTSITAQAAATSPPPAAPQLRSHNTNVGSSNTATVNRPTGLAVDDIMVVGLMFEKGSSVSTMTPPAGWTQIRRTNSGSDVGMVTFWKRAVLADTTTTSYSFTMNQGPKWAIGISAWSGARADATPVHVDNGNTGEGSSTTANQVTTTVDRCAVLCFYTNKKDATYTPASGTTERYDHPNTSQGMPSNMLATFEQTTAGATGNKTAVASEGEKWCAQQVALRPPA